MSGARVEPTDQRVAVVLAPAAPLAVLDLAITTPEFSTRGAFWAAALGSPVPEAPGAAGRETLESLTERWCAGRTAVAACCAGGRRDAIPQATQARFCETWVGAAADRDAGAALNWVLAGFADGRFERALLGAIVPTAEIWMVLAPLDAARAAGQRVLACWTKPSAAGATLLVTAAGCDPSGVERGIAARFPAEPSSLPVRTLWTLGGDGGSDAVAVLTACVAAVLAVAHRTLPPSRGPGDWHGPRERGFGHFPQARPWLFEPGRTPRTALALIPGEGKAFALAFSDADAAGSDPLELLSRAHLFVLSAPSEGVLRADIQALHERVASASTDLAEIAAELWSRPRHRHRCAVVASSRAELIRCLAVTSARLEGAKAAPSPRERVFIGASDYAGTPLAFVIPGQGPQYAGMLRELALTSSAARRAFESVATAFAENDTSLMPLLFPAKDLLGTEPGRELEAFWRDVTGGGLVGCAASQALAEFLATYGVQPAIFLGHSIGETTALTLADGLGPKPPGHVEALARAVGKLRADLLRISVRIGEAGIAVSGVERERIERALAAHGAQAFLALDNCPHQVVLLGEKHAIEAMATELRAEGAACLDVSLGAPFHTPLFAGALPAMSSFYDRLGLRAPRIPVWSGAGNASFPDDPAEMRALLLRQWAETVRFSASVRALYERGVRVFLEVGPGDTLSGFIDDTLRDRDHLAIACDSQWFGGVEHLLAALGRLFVAGVELGAPSRAEAPPRDSASTRPPVEPPRSQGDAAAAVRSGHAALMRELDASRARVLAALPAGGSAGPGRPRSGISAFPALGTRREGGDGSVAFERRLTLESDPYLRDHLFGGVRSPYARELSGLPVVPAAMTLEMLAEAGLAAVSPDRRACVTRVERLRLHRWLTLDRGFLDVRLVARPQPEGGSSQRKIDVELFELHEAAPAGRWSAAEATVVVAAGLPSPPPARHLPEDPDAPARPAERYPKELVFQGASFRGFERSLRRTKAGIEATVIVPPRDRLFAGEVAPALATGANIIDASGQAIARWVADHRIQWDGIYPFHVESYEHYAPLPPPGERLLCVAQVQDDGTVVEADVEFQRLDGTVLYRYLGFRQRRFPMTAEVVACIRAYDVDYEFSRPLDAGAGLHARLLDGGYHDIVRPERAIFRQTIAHTVLSAREREAWQAIPQGSPRRAGWLMGRVAAKEAVRRWVEERHGRSLGLLDIEIGADERGKPTVSFLDPGGPLEPPELSISHANTMAVALVAADMAVGIDIEEQRDGKPRDVPELAFAEGELAEAARASVPPIALWCAKEAAAKALGVGLLGEPRRWRVRDLAPGGAQAVVLVEGLRIPVALHRLPSAIVAVAQAPREVAADARTTLRAGAPMVVKPA